MEIYFIFVYIYILVLFLRLKIKSFFFDKRINRIWKKCSIYLGAVELNRVELFLISQDM